MTPEQKFKNVYPRATIESQKRSGPGGKRYYLVRKTRGDGMWSGCGNTKAQAWKDAARTLPLPLVPPATQAENDLVNFCNHLTSSDRKVAALRAYVASRICAGSVLPD